MEIATIAAAVAFGSLMLGVINMAMKMGRIEQATQANTDALDKRPAVEVIEGLKQTIDLLRVDVDRRLDEKASSESVRALTASVDQLRTDVNQRLDLLIAGQNKEKASV